MPIRSVTPLGKSNSTGAVVAARGDRIVSGANCTPGARDFPADWSARLAPRRAGRRVLEALFGLDALGDPDAVDVSHARVARAAPT